MGSQGMFHDIHIHLCTLTLAWLFSVLAAAQYASNPLVLNYKKADYQAASQNWGISFDSAGIAYFGNNNGLLEFDGSNWSMHYLPDNATVRSVASDGRDRIYVGSHEQFGYMESDSRGQFSYVSLSDSIDPEHFHNDEIWRIVLHQGKIYFQSFDKIYIYNGNKIQIIQPETAIVLLMKARERLFIHKVNDGLYEVMDDKLEFIKGSGILAHDEIKTVLPYGTSDFIVGAASGGLYLYREGTFRPWEIDAASEIAAAEINAGLFINGVYVIGTIVEGVYILEQDGTLRNHIHAGNSLVNNTVQYMAGDRFNNVWLAMSNGLSYINLNDELGYHIDPSGEFGSVYAAALYREELYLGTNQGLFIMDFEEGIPGNLRMHETIRGQVWDLEVIDDALYCGHATGTFRLTPGEVVRVSTINGGYDIEKITIDEQEYLIQSTYSSLAVYLKKGSHWEFSHIVSGYIEPTPNIELDHLGNLWASHLQRGIFRIQLKEELDSVFTVQYYGNEEGLPREKNLAVAKVGNRIVFTTGIQIYTYDDIQDTIVPYDQLNRKLGEYAQSIRIFPGRQNHYWFIQGEEISCFKISVSDVQQLFQYDLSRQGIYMVEDLPRVIPLAGSQDLICLENGFALYQEDNTSPPTYGYSMNFREIYAETQAGERQYLQLNPPQEPRELDYSYRNLQFVFYSIQNCKISKFSYRLVGLNEEWSEWTPSSRILYTRLAWGKYTFEVKTRDLHGREGNTISYPFIIRPPWYFSTISWIVYSCIVLSAIIFIRIVFMRRLRLHKERIEQEKLEKLNQEQRENEQKIIKLRNESLRSEVSHKNIQLANYTMTLIRKNELLQKIKQELDQQKQELGSRYPNFLYEKITRLVERGITSEDEWKIFEDHFDQAHQNFFKRLIEIFPDLTQSDLKLCAYLRMNLSSKEIASLLNITTRGVEIARYRLRKRLNLETEENLVEFILSF